MTLPRAGAGPAVTLVSIYTPPGVAIKQGGHEGLEPARMARLDLARADWIARCTGDLVAKIDRSSGRDHEKVVSLIINHEMALRAALRNAQSSEATGIRPEAGQVEHDVELIRLARATREETIKKTGLGEDLASARIYLGETPARLTGPQTGVPEPSAADRIRSMGRPLTFMGVIPGIDQAPSNISLTFESRPWDAILTAPRDQSIIAFLLLAAILAVTSSLGRWPWSNSVALLATLGLAAITGGPLILALGLVLAAVGWKMARA
jgi:hypothetical protein